MSHPQFELNGERVEATWDNTVLHLHSQETEYDHITIRKQQSGLVLAYFIFRPNLEDFDGTAERLIEDDFPFMHRPTASEETKARFEHQFSLAATFPEEWAK